MYEQKFSFVATLITGEKFDLVACNIIKPDIEKVDTAINAANTVFDLGLSPLESIRIESLGDNYCITIFQNRKCLEFDRIHNW